MTQKWKRIPLRCITVASAVRVTKCICQAWHGRTQKQCAQMCVSHLHRDLEQVRPIRNELERRGHHPLRFFLKCLEDEGRPARTHPEELIR